MLLTFYIIAENFLKKGMFQNCSCLETCEKTTYETDLSYAFFQSLRIQNSSSLLSQYKDYVAVRYPNQSFDQKLDAWNMYLR